jgi:hypothetical protein
MAGEAQFEELIEDLRACLKQARELNIEHAVCLLNMTIMEVSEQYVDTSRSPAGAEEARVISFQPRSSL